MIFIIDVGLNQYYLFCFKWFLPIPVIFSIHERKTQRTEVIFYQYSFHDAVQFSVFKNDQCCKIYCRNPSILFFHFYILVCGYFFNLVGSRYTQKKNKTTKRWVIIWWSYFLYCISCFCLGWLIMQNIDLPEKKVSSIIHTSMLCRSRFIALHGLFSEVLVERLLQV